MAFKSYNNNDNGPVNTTYSGVSFSNPGSEIAQTKISISYFNKVMKVAISMRNNAGSNNEYATYDNDNAVVVFVSNIKAKILSDMITFMKTNNDIHNVCVELKNGLIKISDGSEFGSSVPCISISYAGEDGSVHEIVYQTKKDFHTGAYNYNNGTFESKVFNDIELDTFQMVLDEYYKASSYAIAASVMEANMYKRDAIYNIIKSIAEKVGAYTLGSSNPAKYNSKTFLSNNQQSSSTNPGSMIPKEYESTSFDDIANSMI